MMMDEIDKIIALTVEEDYVLHYDKRQGVLTPTIIDKLFEEETE